MTPEQIEALKREVFNAVKDDLIAGETIEGLGDVALVIDHLAATGRLLPEGCVAVPEEPTGPMLMMGIHAHERNDDLPDIGLGPKCKAIYRAMISAAKKG